MKRILECSVCGFKSHDHSDFCHFHPDIVCNSCMKKEEAKIFHGLGLRRQRNEDV